MRRWLVAALVGGAIVTPLYVACVGIVQSLMNLPILAVQRTIGRWPRQIGLSRFRIVHGAVGVFPGRSATRHSRAGMQAVLGSYFEWPAKVAYIVGVLLFFGPI